MQLQASALARRPCMKKMPISQPLQIEGPRGNEVLSREETDFLWTMELTRAIKRKHFTREEEVPLFRIYARLAARAKQIEKTLKKGKANGNEEDLRAEAEIVAKTMSKITGIIVMANYRLICKIARREAIRFHLPMREIENLIGEGKIGAMKGVEKYDLGRGCKYATYGEWWIRQAITRHLQDTGRTVRVPVHVNEDMTKITRFVREYTQRNGSSPDGREISEGTGIAEDKVRKLSLIKADEKSSRCEIDEDDTADPDSENPPETIARRELREIIMRNIEQLSEDRQRILIQRFGLDGEDFMTLQEVGDEMDLTKERIRQIQNEELKKMRRSCGSEMQEYL